MLNKSQYLKNVLRHLRDIVGYASRYNKLIKGPDLLIEDIAFDILPTRKSYVEVNLTFQDDLWKIADKKTRDNGLAFFVISKIRLNDTIKKHWKTDRLPYSIFPDAESNLSIADQQKSDTENFKPIIGGVRASILEHFYSSIHSLDYINVGDRGLYSINNSDPIGLEPPHFSKCVRANYGIGIDGPNVKFRLHLDFFKKSNVNIAGIKPNSSNVTILDSETTPLEKNDK